MGNKTETLLEQGKEYLMDKPDKYKTLQKIVKDHGFSFERHFYETADDYINCLHRVHGPRGSDRPDKGNPRPVILYQHGILDSSVGACCNGKESSLAFFFAEAGFDVWMNNARGNIFSWDHVQKDPDNDEKYWEFSFQ